MSPENWNFTDWIAHCKNSGLVDPKAVVLSKYPNAELTCTRTSDGKRCVCTVWAAKDSPDILNDENSHLIAKHLGDGSSEEDAWLEAFLYVTQEKV